LTTLAEKFFNYFVFPQNLDLENNKIEKSSPLVKTVQVLKFDILNQLLKAKFIF
jgi:hypothetical protein